MTADQKRCTGRTTRMMEAAKFLVADGFPVYIIAADANHARIIKEQFRCEFGWPAVLPRSHWSYDERHNMVIGAAHNSVVLVDHYAADCVAADRRAMRGRRGS